MKNKYADPPPPFHKHYFPSLCLRTDAKEKSLSPEKPFPHVGYRVFLSYAASSCLSYGSEQKSTFHTVYFTSLDWEYWLKGAALMVESAPNKGGCGAPFGSPVFGAMLRIAPIVIIFLLFILFARWLEDHDMISFWNASSFAKGAIKKTAWMRAKKNKHHGGQTRPQRMAMCGISYCLVLVQSELINGTLCACVSPQNKQNIIRFCSCKKLSKLFIFHPFFSSFLLNAVLTLYFPFFSPSPPSHSLHVLSF